MRLDFEAFTILGPADTVETGGGVCVDSFVASAVSFFKHSWLCHSCIKTNSDTSTEARVAKVNDGKSYTHLVFFLQTATGAQTPVICGENSGQHSK